MFLLLLLVNALSLTLAQVQYHRGSLPGPSASRFAIDPSVLSQYRDALSNGQVIRDNIYSSPTRGVIPSQPLPQQFSNFPFATTPEASLTPKTPSVGPQFGSFPRQGLFSPARSFGIAASEGQISQFEQEQSTQSPTPAPLVFSNRPQPQQTSDQFPQLPQQSLLRFQPQPSQFPQSQQGNGQLFSQDEQQLINARLGQPQPDLSRTLLYQQQARANAQVAAPQLTQAQLSLLSQQRFSPNQISQLGQQEFAPTQLPQLFQQQSGRQGPVTFPNPSQAAAAPPAVDPSLFTAPDSNGAYRLQYALSQ